MSHWDRFQRFYIALTIFVSVYAGAAVVVFGSLTADEINGLTARIFAVDCIKCIALASANLLTYLQASKKPAPTVP